MSDEICPLPKCVKQLKKGDELREDDFFLYSGGNTPAMRRMGDTSYFTNPAYSTMRTVDNNHTAIYRIERPAESAVMKAMAEKLIKMHAELKQLKEDGWSVISNLIQNVKILRQHLKPTGIQVEFHNEAEIKKLGNKFLTDDRD